MLFFKCHFPMCCFWLVQYTSMQNSNMLVGVDSIYGIARQHCQWRKKASHTNESQVKWWLLLIVIVVFVPRRVVVVVVVVIVVVVIFVVWVVVQVL
jgi:hypothetical protein